MGNENNDKELNEFVFSVVKKMAKMTYIRPEEIPNIDLYMDQVTTFMDEHLSDAKRHSEDKILTKTMINNYAKNDLLPPPDKKKYSKDHMIMLIFIYYFKSLMSISDIQTLLGPLSEEIFGGEGDVSMSEVYKRIYNYERSHMVDVAKGISKNQRDAMNLFEDVEDPDERTYLQLFSLVGMLSFDVYSKKYVIQSVIDELEKARIAMEEKAEARREAKKAALKRARREKKEKK
ncbi:MAG: DUF1836 domain-containing protein [Lachnospiraceae bacterium]|nr:DUF1836 domain-containing protein [Lachnospiraceae bacterium]